MDSHSVHQFLTDLKIIEPIHKPLHEFETPDEFNIYYHKHKDEMDKETTHLLNKKFSINGYRITKIKGVLCLKRSTMKTNQRLIDQREKKDDLQERLQKLEEVVNQIIDVINRTTKCPRISMKLLTEGVVNSRLFHLIKTLTHTFNVSNNVNFDINILFKISISA